MSARKSERLLNLLITLLVARSYVSKERLRGVVEQYRDLGPEAFEKMFERDKEELRSLGVPIEVGYLDKAFEDEPGYRVDRSAFELPEVALEPDEAAVLGLAARVWQHAGLAAATSDALVKLRAAGVDVDREALAMAQPLLAAEEPTFEAFWDATRTRTAVSFDYRTSAGTVATRHLEPWGVVSYGGRWYVVGQDTDRAAPRLFRLSRVRGQVTRARRSGTFTVPEGTDIRALAASLAPAPADHRATLRVRHGAAHGLRRQAVSLSGAVSGPAGGQGGDGWDRLEAAYGSTDAFAQEVLGYGADVVVEDPPELRDAVLAGLRAVAGVAR